ncbi:hypothetical protein P7K49_010329 [Saguinus oedipus]|uniref:BHLH domain-containing protein n=1 Tax=Saguinus oedipus TaxID=9490 RepID=A0ABQ9VMH7_SAGOE|nr:hypothetical protein P7K49_010329 [Saguinus oedipus]
MAQGEHLTFCFKTMLGTARENLGSGSAGEEACLVESSFLSLLSVWVSGSEPEKFTTNWRRTGVCARACGTGPVRPPAAPGSGSPALSRPCPRPRRLALLAPLPRRAHLKECFETLKRNIPNVDDKKTSNLSVLRTALRYIQVWGPEADAAPASPPSAVPPRPRPAPPSPPPPASLPPPRGRRAHGPADVSGAPCPEKRACAEKGAAPLPRRLRGPHSLRIPGAWRRAP